MPHAPKWEQQERERASAISEKVLVIYLMHILSTAHYHLVDYEGSTLLFSSAYFHSSEATVKFDCFNMGEMYKLRYHIL